MTVDVLILAGGLGTRLRGKWDTSVCLMPVAGRPLLDRILRDHVMPLPGLNRVLISLGHQGTVVRDWLNEQKDLVKLKGLMWTYDGGPTRPLGTAGALRQCAKGLSTPLLVLNGNTLLRGRPLGSLLEFHKTHDSFVTAALRCSYETPYRKYYAGAAVFSADALEKVLADKHVYDFEAFLVGARAFYVSGYLDAATPEGADAAQKMFEENLL